MLLDNTNADQDVRAVWVNLAKKHSIPVRCVLFTASAKLCEHNDTVRALNLGQEVGFSTLAASPGTGSMRLPDAVTPARDRLALVLTALRRIVPGLPSEVHLRTIDMFTNCYQTNPENRTILPKLAFTSFASRFRAPKLEEGFKEIVTVDFEVSVVRPQTR